MKIVMAMLMVTLSALMMSVSAQLAKKDDPQSQRAVKPTRMAAMIAAIAAVVIAIIAVVDTARDHSDTPGTENAA